jgi:hypothetical protein
MRRGGSRGRFVLVFVLGVAALVAAPSALGADTVSTDFESFALGSPNGQHGWVALGSAGMGCATYDHAIADPTSFGVTAFGHRSLRASNAVATGCFSDQTFSAPVANAAGESTDLLASPGSAPVLTGGTRLPYYEAQWDFASAVPTAEQPNLLVVGSPDRGDGARMSWIGMSDTSGGLDVGFYDFQGYKGNPNSGDFVHTDVASGLDRLVPHTVKVTMDLCDGPTNDIVRVFVDGRLVHTGGSWEDYYRSDPTQFTANTGPAPPGPRSRTAARVMFRTGGTAPPNAPALLGKGFLFDNFHITTSQYDPIGSTCGVINPSPASATAPAPSTTTVAPRFTG